MKIWYQSSSSYGYEPVFEEYGKTLEEQCNKIVRPDTEVHVEGIEVMVRDIENQKATISRAQQSHKWTLTLTDFDELEFIELFPIILTR